MTITIALKTPEGIVLGADSTTTVMDQTGKIAQLFNSAQKILEIGPSADGFIAGDHFSGGIATYNAGSFGPVSWRNLVNDFYRHKIRPSSQPLDISREFLSYAQQEWSKLQQAGSVPATAQIPDAGFMIATVNKCESEVFGSRVELRNATVEPLVSGSIQIGGGFEVVSRLLWGYDVGLEPVLAQLGVNIALSNRPRPSSKPCLRFTHFRCETR